MNLNKAYSELKFRSNNSSSVIQTVHYIQSQ